MSKKGVQMLKNDQHSINFEANERLASTVCSLLNKKELKMTKINPRTCQTSPFLTKSEQTVEARSAFASKVRECWSFWSILGLPRAQGKRPF